MIGFDDTAKTHHDGISTGFPDDADSIRHFAVSLLPFLGEDGRRPDEGLRAISEPKGLCSLWVFASLKVPHPPLRGTFSQGWEKENPFLIPNVLIGNS
jgi:hypothetical protein